MLKNITLLILTAIALLTVSCTASSNQTAQSEPPKNSDASATPKPANQTAPAPNQDSKETVTKKTESTGDQAACLNAKIEGKRLIANQTFVFDFEPFKKSCFVTFGSKEDMLDEKDVPRGSTFYIYKDGKQIYQFEDAFDGQPACWVEGVGFEDLNNDGKTEVIIAGSCLGAKNSYPMNAVYLNIRDDFKTVSTSNSTLENFKTIKQISDFVKKNNNKFFDDK